MSVTDEPTDQRYDETGEHRADDPQAGQGPSSTEAIPIQTTDHQGSQTEDQPGSLGSLAERFRRETQYPTEDHEEQMRLRAEWAEKLKPENIGSFSRLDLAKVCNFHVGHLAKCRYVLPNDYTLKNIEDVDNAEYERWLENIKYLCSDADELWHRYDQLIDIKSSRKMQNIGDYGVSKLLAICHPQEFLPIAMQGGEGGREWFLERFGLPKSQCSTYGQTVVDANNRLRDHLKPHFGRDLMGMAAFIEWLYDEDIQVPEPPKKPEPDLERLADELLVEPGFLEDIVELLGDKGQVILYGPPGTGKTYLARELAKELAPSDSCRALVQFHPSTSYEDFFEGYRPAGTGDDGGISYELKPGPLARIAEQASRSPDRPHVMIIDEINRGNLPRVLGELLFLLEYRDESMQTLYRPDEPFSLPKNLWFIGTMNTADRSIALVDAALRRRFHFVPFFPDSGPMANLLEKWLERENEPSWVGKLVNAVNGELKKELEGSNLLLGPSHFMKKYGSAVHDQQDRLRRIWEYNIEPFIEDQFFGDPDSIERFRFDAVMSRHKAIVAFHEDLSVNKDPVPDQSPDEAQN